MEEPVPSADASAGASGNGQGDEDDEDDAEALKAHIAKMKAGGDASAGNGEALARSVKCSEVRSISLSLVLSLFSRFPSLPLFPSTLPPLRSYLFPSSCLHRGKIHDANSNLHKQCGKIFKNQDLVSFHAEKSGHSAFEESTEEVSHRERAWVAVVGDGH